MQTIDGRQYGTRDDLAELSGYSVRSVAALWAEREANGHPEARIINGIRHWDAREWLEWLPGALTARRDAARPIDRSGDPDEELPPAAQARLLGLDKSAVSQYRKKPPPGWPDPVRVEQLPSGRTREYRTRRQLWKYHDGASASRIGVAGRPARKGPDPREQLAMDAVREQPGRKAADIRAELAEKHGQSPLTWKPFVAAARKKVGR
jgi:hypothetical protein